MSIWPRISRRCSVCELVNRVGEEVPGNFFTIYPNPAPINGGHIVLAHRFHKPLRELSDEELRELKMLLDSLEAFYRERYKAQGVNIVFGIDEHAYVEVVPRWCGDFSFTVLRGFKTVPETPRQYMPTILEWLRNSLKSWRRSPQ